MSLNEIVIQGIVQPDGRLELREPIRLPPGPVEVRITVCSAKQESLVALLARIQEENKALGRVPRSVEEIDAEINELRQEADDELLEIERLHEAAMQGKDWPPC